MGDNIGEATAKALENEEKKLRLSLAACIGPILVMMSDIETLAGTETSEKLAASSSALLLLAAAVCFFSGTNITANYIRDALMIEARDEVGPIFAKYYKEVGVRVNIGLGCLLAGYVLIVALMLLVVW
ncbi:MAG: hypothetical protein LJE68_00815 [Rhodobacter sp.]|jgi:hypothetical protein|nr:hypothetical protein [Rhodobacter sp.]